jgi:hypothetical protein
MVGKSRRVGGQLPTMEGEDGSGWADGRNWTFRQFWSGSGDGGGGGGGD